MARPQSVPAKTKDIASSLAAHGEPAAAAGGTTWPRGWRILASCAIVFHVGAVFIAPLAAPPPSSLLAQRLASNLDPYLRGLAINNGYRFFAPNPGPSHLVRYEIELGDGRVETGVFPDPEAHWPRLLYHRYFMLSETVYNRARASLEPPPEVYASWPEAEQQAFRRFQDESETLYRDIARDLAREHSQLQRVRLYARTHEIPTPRQLQRGIPLNDPRLYVDVPLAEFSRDEL